ncbi:endonuclease/exonuclease/phosphatase family protein [Phycisphaera mikurensis]|uniref:Endonuclease/exonuclease/phosphatase domain-containing protein n=1 Tax=Phycisphaera mikurensis (strain NBRC 102666 / KCTC 22515 / FYK2301M01) TaxID=1142394 RepID=I0ID19_PHYMF|nr:endonuclease/exonuclease/phosphatase family protein [Phycisphaera mikurensis]MBB6442282.1 hypothetical protein [Phycisphaera mikurensis]BAM03157.1 hypothetical protein PSMK_09980 [Phycisphaera mikurensis NBRC 102666]
MRQAPPAVLLLLLLLLAFLPLGACAGAGGAGGPATARFAAFNTSLSAEGTADSPAYLAAAEEASPLAEKARAVAAVLRAVRPDVVLLSEFDDAGDGRSIARLVAMLQEEGGAGGEPLQYTAAWHPPVNTGEPSGLDLDADGAVGGPGDAWGWGTYPGQFGLLLLSRFPIDAADARSFRLVRWADQPENAMPAGFYPAGVAEELRLSSKTHADVGVRVPLPGGGEREVRVLVSHPTPPVFDGPEDRNGRRNADEIRFWTRYLSGPETAGVPAVLLGDLNADPFDGEGDPAAIRGLLAAPGVRGVPTPASAGGPAAAERDGGANATHRGPAAHDTADFGDAGPHGPGNLRVDYALPVRLEPLGAGVFWPADGPMAEAAAAASDHRLVWVDVRVD